MIMMKKATVLVLALGMMGSMVACGGGGNNGGNGDNGNAKGEQITATEWAAAMTHAFSADNVTANVYLSASYSEDGYSMGGSGSGTLKIANDKIHEKMSYTQTMGGESMSFTDETYIAKVDGVYYQWYKDSIDTLDWEMDICYDAEYEETFATTIGGYVLLDYLLDVSLEGYIAIFEDLVYDASAGEYKLVEGEGDEFYTVSFKIVDGKLYTVTAREQESVGYEEMKYVFYDYGTTTIGNVLGTEDEGNEEESSSTGGEIGGGEVGGDDSGQGVDEAGWNVALYPAGDYQYVQSANGVEVATYKVDGDTVYSVQEAGERYYSVEDGKYYLYEKREDAAWTKTELSATDYAMEVGMIKINWSDAFPYASFTFNTETGCYEAASIVFGGEVALTNVSVKIANGKLAQMSYSIEGMELSLAFTYQEITLVLPEVNGEVGGDVGGDVGGETEMPVLEQVDAAGWAAAIAATRAATNFSAVVTMEAYAIGSGMTGPAATGSAIMNIADNKGYVEMTTTMAGMNSSTHLSYCGNVDGKCYTWDSYDNGATWYCEMMSDAMDINGDWMVAEMFCSDMTFETATYDAETKLYSYTTEDGETYRIGFADGKVAYHSYSYTENMGSVMEMTEWYVFTYGNATVGDLPPVTVS